MIDEVLFCGTDGGEDFDALDDVFEEFAFPEGRLFHHLAESDPVQAVQFARRFAHNCGSSRGIVHQSQFSKRLSVAIGFEVLFFSLNHFRAIELPTVDDKKIVSAVALSDHFLSGLVLSEIHGLDEGFLIAGVDVLE